MRKFSYVTGREAIQGLRAVPNFLDELSRNERVERMFRLAAHASGLYYVPSNLLKNRSDWDIKNVIYNKSHHYRD